MSTLTAPAHAPTGRAWATAGRFLLLAVAIIVLIAAAFAVGRATGDTGGTSGRAPVPAVSSTNSQPATTTACRPGQLC